jgi:uncharacterized protein YneF (UPF0154 family)
MGGTGEDYFCRKCVLKQRSRMGVGSVILSVIVCLFWAMMIGAFLTPKSGSFNYEPWLWAGVAVGVIAGLFIAYTRPDEEVGDRLAVKNNRRRIRGLGWDTLFTRKEREKLR